jgi:hypothetical protein
MHELYGKMIEKMLIFNAFPIGHPTGDGQAFRFKNLSHQNQNN